MNILKIVSYFYDRNPLSYQLLRELKEQICIVNIFKSIVILPMIPIWNFFAKKEIDMIKNNGSIYAIRNGMTLFYLPDLNLRGGEFVQNRIFLEKGYFEQRRLKQVRTYIKEGSIMIDVGANIGNHTLFFMKECQAQKIYAFEPVRKTFDILKKNIVINQLENKVVLCNVALGNCKGKADILYCERDAGGNQVKEKENGNIDIIMLDDLQFSEHIDFIKIDVEGYELKVLEGARGILKRDHPVIMVEIFDSNFQMVDFLLKRLHYKLKLKLENDYIYTANTD